MTPVTTQSTDGIVSRRIDELLAAADDAMPVAQAMRALVDAGFGALPLPAGGATLARWRALADVAGHDLSLVKCFEGHTDALAILAELDGPAAPSGSVWGTWCAEPPSARLQVSAPDDAGALRLSGTKAWCSGAALVTHAVVSGWNADGAPCLAAVDMQQPGISVHDERWQAVGMAASASHEVRFADVPAQALGEAHGYVRRPGFWHGGAGIAACWWGGARGVARRVRASLPPAPNPHALAHLGALDVALSQAAALLRETADWIDTHPQQDAMAPALRLRAAVEHCCDTVLHHATRAGGAGPLCGDARLAHLVADLPVYLRQSHAEKDLAVLGGLLCGAVGRDESPWPL